MINFPRPEELIAEKKKEFWKQIAALGIESSRHIYAVTKTLHRGKTITQDDAREALAALFIHSHARIRSYFPEIAVNYPTGQYTDPARQNLKDKPLFWVDHFTGGVRLASTLKWFSDMRLSDGSRPKASAHFVIGYHDLPYYIIPIDYCAWHARSRNKDSIGVEMVNAGPVHTKDGSWHFFAGPIPPQILFELIPRRLTTPYKGVSNFLPYTDDQIINNILLKRLVIDATGTQLTRERFTGHSDWQEGKLDPGPLWPMDDINDAAFEMLALDDYRFIEHLHDAPTPARATDKEASVVADYPAEEREDRDAEDTQLLTIAEVQKLLVEHGYPLAIDGIYGPKTKSAVRTFQRHWNNAHEHDRLKVDGIPGPMTCLRLTQGVSQ